MPELTGEALRYEVLETVFGHSIVDARVARDCPRYESDIAAAFEVVERLIEILPQGDIHIEHLDGEWGVATCQEDDGWVGWVRDKSLPVAICRAALAALEAGDGGG